MAGPRAGEGNLALLSRWDSGLLSWRHLCPQDPYVAATAASKGSYSPVTA
jgi:hypothetical protein